VARSVFEVCGLPTGQPVGPAPLRTGRQNTGWRQVAALAGTAVLAFGLALGGSAAGARESSAQPLPDITLAQLPEQARETERLIRAGGPFPYTKDGTVFGNRERILPRERRGFYREYTVRTPGSRDRGARRIVCGGEQVREPEACFYTEDHYASFKRIVR
jgi:ribonuclease T1